MIDQTRPRFKTRFATPDLFDLYSAVLGVSRVSDLEMQGTLRHREVVSARRAFVALARARTRCSYPEIAVAMGAPTHTTALAQHRAFLSDADDGAIAIVAQVERLLSAAPTTPAERAG